MIDLKGDLGPDTIDVDKIKDIKIPEKPAPVMLS
jgi:hypothetical protein